MKKSTSKTRSEPPIEIESVLNLDLFPPVPKDARPREIVFDTLPSIDVDALSARGYKPILMRWLPRRNQVEDLQWLARLMQGAAEGTIAVSKERLGALRLELDTKRLLSDKAAPLNIHDQRTVDDTNPLAGLEWGETQHTFRGNTTQVAPEKVYEFVREAAQHAAKPKPERPIKRRKRSR